MKRLGPGDAVLCAGTVATAGFAERVEAASAAGFAGLSLFITDYFRARAEGLTDADLRSLLADHDLAVAEIDPLLCWVPGVGMPASVDASGAAFFEHDLTDFLEVAEAVGARSLNLALVAEHAIPRDELAAAFAAVCDRAAEHDLLVHLEFLPWTHLPDLAAALAVVEGAGRPNGGVTVDAWHLFRSGGDAAAVAAAPGARILSVQLDDAPRVPEANLILETTHRRLLPGEGELDLVGLLRALREIDAPAPFGIEVFSDELVALPVGEVARRAADSLRTLRAKAGV